MQISEGPCRKCLARRSRWGWYSLWSYSFFLGRRHQPGLEGGPCCFEGRWHSGGPGCLGSEAGPAFTSSYFASPSLSLLF